MTTQQSPRTGVTVLRVRGVPVRVSGSFLVLVGLIFWSLAAAVFPAQYPDESTLVRTVMAGAATFLLLASLVAHELCHSVQSLREGVPVRGIQLWMLGGVSEMAEPIEKPWAEFRVVAAGPAMSASLTAVFLAAAAGASWLGVPAPWVGVLVYAGWSNAVLLAFNVVPALPLDGGRLLHALLWLRSGDTDRATVQAGKVGQVLAALLAAGGVLLFTLGSGSLSGFWFILIGAYLYAAAGREVAVARRSSVLRSARALDLVPAGSLALEAGTSLEQLSGLVLDHPAVSAFPVVERGDRLGVLVLKDAGAVPLEVRDRVRARDVMQSGDATATVPGHAAARDVARLLASGDVRVVVVSVAGRDVGAVTAGDVDRYLADHRSR